MTAKALNKHLECKKAMSDTRINEVLASLHRLERAVLPFLGKMGSVDEIIPASGMQEVEVLRALNWLQGKGLVKLTESIEEMIQLGQNGKLYVKTQLPEVRFLNSLMKGQATLPEIKRAAGLSDEEVGASIGTLMKLGAIEPVPGAAEKTFRIAASGKELVSKGFKAQKLLSKSFPIKLKNLTGEEKAVVAELKRRKDVVIESVAKKWSAALTADGLEVARLLKTGKAKEMADRLTPEMLSTGKWKTAEFRSYDLSASVPRVFFGKPQPYREFLDEVRADFVAMGFEEMVGPMVESEFWDMDALFMPQFHSAREIHDVYYVKAPKHATDLPPALIKKVKMAHENGFGTGSKGWGYSFSEEKTRRMIMRSQTTACSARMLASKELKIPSKYFAIGRCFRYDVIDATHLADFNQVEGIVAEEKITLKELIGLLKLFAKELCQTDKVKVVPSYFPFTEPSVGLYAKHPSLGWLELGGAGIFRPEMVKPLVGRQIGVIAWGIGIDRIGMFKLGINDIRNLFSHDLEFLRNTKVI